MRPRYCRSADSRMRMQNALLMVFRGCKDLELVGHAYLVLLFQCQSEWHHFVQCGEVLGTNDISFRFTYSHIPKWRAQAAARELVSAGFWHTVINANYPYADNL